MFPVRCFTCGAVIADVYDKYIEDVKAGKDKEKILNELEVSRYCCRRMFVSGVDITDTLIKYKRL